MPYSTRTMTDEDWQKLKPFFAKSEFLYPDKMGYEFMLLLLEIRKRANVVMKISSSHRNKEHNKKVGGAPDSAHTDEICEAVDIKQHKTAADPNWNYARYQIMEAFFHFNVGRIGLYPNGSLHFDKTEDKRPSPRLWVKV